MVGPIPSDFANVGFSALERDLNALVSGSDAWTVPNEPDACIPWHDRSALSDRQVSLEARWGQQQPQPHVDIEPWIMYYMDHFLHP